MEEEDTTEECTTCAEIPAPTKPKQKRTSKTWLVTVKTDTEEVVMKVRNVLSAEAAMESARSVHGVVEVISAKPARTFK